MTAFTVIMGIGLGTYVLRATMLVLVAVRPLPAWLSGGLGLVGPAAVAALVATLTLTHGGALAPLPAAQLLAIGVGFLAVRHTGNVVHAFAAGMPVFWVLSPLLG